MKKMRMKMKPNELRAYIEQMKKQHLLLKHEIEAYEFELSQSRCPDCNFNLNRDLRELLRYAKEARFIPKVVKNLEQYLAEDEAANGWKGEDRWIIL